MMPNFTLAGSLLRASNGQSISWQPDTVDRRAAYSHLLSVRSSAVVR
jgi:hypothetical protein